MTSSPTHVEFCIQSQTHGTSGRYLQLFAAWLHTIPYSEYSSYLRLCQLWYLLPNLKNTRTSGVPSACFRSRGFFQTKNWGNCSFPFSQVSTDASWSTISGRTVFAHISDTKDVGCFFSPPHQPTLQLSGYQLDVIRFRSILTLMAGSSHSSHKNSEVSCKS